MSNLLKGFLFIVLFSAGVFAQQSVQNTANDMAPLNSESNIVQLEYVAREAIAESAEGRKTIIIARLGKGEFSSQLNRRRLYNVQTFLSNHKIGTGNIVIAEGKHMLGYGRVEIYVGGKLAVTLTVPKNKDLMVDCCEGNTDYYPSKDLLRRGMSKRKK